MANTLHAEIRKALFSAKGRRDLAKTMARAKAFMAKMRRDSVIPRSELYEPMMEGG